MDLGVKTEKIILMNDSNTVEQSFTKDFLVINKSLAM